MHTWVRATAHTCVHTCIHQSPRDIYTYEERKKEREDGKEREREEGKKKGREGERERQLLLTTCYKARNVFTKRK